MDVLWDGGCTTHTLSNSKRAAAQKYDRLIKKMDEEHRAEIHSLLSSKEKKELHRDARLTDTIRKKEAELEEMEKQWRRSEDENVELQREVGALKLQVQQLETQLEIAQEKESSLVKTDSRAQALQMKVLIFQ